MVRLGFLAFIVAVCVLTGCEPLPCNKGVDQGVIDAVDKAQLQIDIDSIDTYLAAHNIAAQQDPTGIRYVVRKEGFGGTPCVENLVSFYSKGKFLRSQKQFDNSNAEAQLKGLIIAWQIMLPQFPKGSKIVLYVPSVYAYGADGRKVNATTYAIPPNTNLVFEIEITNIR